MLRRGVAPADATDGAPQKSDFPLSRGKPKSTRLKLELKDRLIFWMLVAVLHALSLLPDFILYKLGIACGLIFPPLRPASHGESESAISRLRSPKRAHAERERILRASYINLGRTRRRVRSAGRILLPRLARRVTYNRLDVWNELRLRGIPARAR